jgi:hypothetical protein
VSGAARRGARRGRAWANRAAARIAARLRLGHYVVLDYPPSSRSPRARHREGPLADVIAAAEPVYREALATIASFEQDLARVPVRAGTDERTPAWVNGFIPGLDGAAIYAFIRSRRPRTYLEVGSGASTRFARRAIEDGGLSTRLISIDPSPRAEVGHLVDETIREPLELADRSLLGDLVPGDVVFLDGSHRVFTGSDATVFTLDLLPALAPGVLVGVHDVYLPDDYPEEVADRHYSEQYLLGALLLGEPSWLRLVLAADYVTRRPELAGDLRALWDRPELAGAETHGVALWLEVTGRGG